MSKGEWIRVCGVPHRRWPPGQPKRADCDVAGTRAVIITAGFTNVTRDRRTLESDKRFHRYEITLADGSKEWETATNSVQWLGGVIRQERRERRLANLGLPPQVIETYVRTEPQQSARVLRVSGRPEAVLLESEWAVWPPPASVKKCYGWLGGIG